MDDDNKPSAQGDHPDLEALFVQVRSHKEQVKIENEEIETQVKVLFHQKEQLDHSKKYLELQEKVLDDLQLHWKSIQDKESALAEQEAELNCLKESLRVEKIAVNNTKAELQGQYQKLIVDNREALDEQAAELEQKSDKIIRDEKALQAQQEEFNQRFMSMEDKERQICSRELELDEQMKKLREIEKSMEQQKTRFKHQVAMLNDKEEALRLRETELNRRESEFEKMRKEFETNHHTVRLPENARIQIIRAPDDSAKISIGTTPVEPVSNGKPNDIGGILALCQICGKAWNKFSRCDHFTGKLLLPLDYVAKRMLSHSETSLKTTSPIEKAMNPRMNPIIRKEGLTDSKGCKTYARAPKSRKIEEKSSESEKKVRDTTVTQECDEENESLLERLRKCNGISVTCEYETRAKPKKASVPSDPPNRNPIPVISLQKTLKHCEATKIEQNDPLQKVDFSIFLACKKIKIGSYEYTPTVGVFMSSFGIRLTAPLPKNNKCTVTINLKSADLKRILVNFDQSMPIFFIYTTPEAGPVIRKNLAMKTRTGPYFDPVSKDQAHKRIILFPDKFMEESKHVLRNMYKAKFEELNKNEANRFLTKATIFNNDESTSRTLSLR